MNKKLLGCGVVVGILLIFGLWAMSGYNNLVSLEEGVKQAWSQVENVYQRRADLIPNLVETVKGAANFERDTFTAVVEARAKVGQVQFAGVPDAQQFAQFQQAQEGLSSALSRLLVVVEKYPELKATEAFRDLQAQLEGTENRITVERGRFTEAAQAFNTARRRFPTVLIAGLLGFKEKPYFEARPGSDQPPKVQF
ncbi:MAG TPA: LemA family protein [Thermoanaerobaculia bacterium]|nr:LemA family protein [Thermoanaerobaculia bacterium]